MIIKIYLIIEKKNRKVYKAFLKGLDAGIWLAKYKREHLRYGKNKYIQVKMFAEGFYDGEPNDKWL